MKLIKDTHRLNSNQEKWQYEQYYLRAFAMLANLVTRVFMTKVLRKIRIVSKILFTIKIDNH